MPGQNAELIFVAGPQNGERGQLMSGSVIIGRSPTCGVQIIEKTVSRMQLRLELTPDGWVAENMSATRIRINGKKYKSKKKIILDTNDVLAFGEKTEILFVAPEDDAEEALALYRREHRESQILQPILVEETPNQGEQSPLDEVETETPIGQQATATAPLSVEDELAEEKKTKKRKYLIAGGIYLVAMVALVIFLVSLKSDGPTDSSGKPLQKLTDEQIRDVIPALLDVRKQPTKAKEALDKAMEFYAGQLDRPGDLYRAVKHFKLHLKFKGSPGFAKTRHGTAALDAENKLIKRFRGAYQNAWILENSKDWLAARAAFEELLQMIPVTEGMYPDDNNRVFKNVLAHLMYVRKHIKKKRRR